MNLKTLPETLFNAARAFPDHGVYYVQSDGTSRFQAYPELLSEASDLLSRMQASGFNAGDKVILSPDRNDETILMLWACLLGGLVPTILQPPFSFSEYNAPLEKLEKVFTVLGKPIVFLSDNLYNKFHSDIIPASSIMSVSALTEKNREPQFFVPLPQDLAFIQFSSGSTGDPKGIELTHKGMLTNINDIGDNLKLGPADRSANWMPLYHDMGLVGYHFLMVNRCMDQFQIETVDFIKRPFLWLDIMTQEKISITGSPNFGQSLILRHLKKKEKGVWDLSSLRTIQNGAEPISVSVMTAFMHELASFELRTEAMMPVYGMAEATLAITFSSLELPPSVICFSREELDMNNRAVVFTGSGTQGKNMVNVGSPLKHVNVRVVDKDDRELPESMVGQIQISGINVTKGYYNNPHANAELFCGEWLRTGDLGFFYKGGLFITGRDKDIIFINGKNYYSHDLETMALEVDGVIAGKIVIAGFFSENAGHDQIVVFYVGPKNESSMTVFKDLNKLFKHNIGIPVDHFVPIRSNEIPKTSSGKIQRYMLISRFRKGEFAIHAPQK